LNIIPLYGQEKNVKIALEMLKENLPVEPISRFIKLTTKEIEEFRQKPLPNKKK
jgi:hypothetical protein